MKHVFSVRNGQVVAVSFESLQKGDIVYVNQKPRIIEQLTDEPLGVIFEDEPNRIHTEEDLDPWPDGYRPGVKFNPAFTTHCPTSEMVEIVQTLRGAAFKMYWGAVETAIEHLENLIQRHTFKPNDWTADISASSVVLSDHAPGIVTLADGSDFPCKAKEPIGSVLACGCSCSECEHHASCFDGASNDAFAGITNEPVDGVIMPAGCDTLYYEPHEYAQKIFSVYGKDIADSPFGPCRLMRLRNQPDNPTKICFARFELFGRYSIFINEFSDGYYHMDIRPIPAAQRPIIELKAETHLDTCLPVSVCVAKIDASNITSMEDLDSLYYERVLAQESQCILQKIFITDWEKTRQTLHDLSNIPDKNRLKKISL